MLGLILLLSVWKSGYGLIQLFSAQKQFRYNFHSHYLQVTHIIYMLVTMEKKQWNIGKCYINMETYQSMGFLTPHALRVKFIGKFHVHDVERLITLLCKSCP